MIIIRLIYLFQGPTPDDLIKKFTKENLSEKKINKNVEIYSKNEKNIEVQNNSYEVNKVLDGSLNQINSFANLMVVLEFLLIVIL